MSNQPGAARPRPRLHRFIQVLFSAGASLIALTSVSCGKVGAPVPPSRITQRTSDLKAVQQGPTVVLSWPAPILVTQESSRDYIARLEIYRLSEAKEEEPVLDTDDYEQRAEAIGYLERVTIEALINALAHLQYADSIDLAGAQGAAGVRLRYAVRYINKRGQKSAFSNTVAIEPLGAVAGTPTDLRVTSTAQDEVRTEWTPPESNVDGTRPASVAGYNVYRRTARRGAFGRPLNSEPVTDMHFTDTKFQYNADYVYLVRALSRGGAGLIESADSEMAAFTPADAFPPSAPEPVSVASANGVISLFWPTSPERDVAGYNIYRAESADADTNAWLKLTTQPLSNVTTFRDDRVALGKTYFYRVTAVDRFDNESPPSRVVSETANP